MSERAKYTIILCFLALVTLPFIFITDLFPFFRFGMFAEPVRSEVQMEVFRVRLVNSNGSIQEYNSRSAGIDPATFSYLCRNYFYRGEGELFLGKIHETLPEKGIRKLTLERSVLTPEGEKKDSTLIYHP